MDQLPHPHQDIRHPDGHLQVQYIQDVTLDIDWTLFCRTLLKEDGTPIRYNYRGVQLLNDRSVNKIDKTVPVPYDLDYTPSTDCKKKVVTGNYFDQRYGVSNVFENNATQAEGTYWLGPSNSDGSFIVDFGCEKQRSILELTNVRDGGRATKKFRVSSSSSHVGPWTELVEGSMEDSRQKTEALELENFSFPSTTDRYFKFEVLDWYGVGGGLQYFDVKGKFLVERISSLISVSQIALTAATVLLLSSSR